MEAFVAERLAPQADSARGRRQLALAIAASIIFHLVVLGLSLKQMGQPALPAKAARPFQVSLVDRNPQLAEPAIEPSVTEQPGKIAQIPPFVDDTAADQPLPEPLQVPALAIEAVPSPPDPGDNSEPPSLLSVRNAVSAFVDRQLRDTWQWECDRLQEQAGVLNCGEHDANRELDYEGIAVNPVYRALNPVRELSRAQQTVGTFAREAPQLAMNIRGTGLPRGLTAYLNEQVESRITLYSFQEKQSQQLLGQLTASPVQQQAARVLGDPVTINQYRLLQQRKRDIIPMTTGEKVRNSVINLGLIWLNLEMNAPD